MKKVSVVALGIILAFVFGAILLAFQDFDPAASYISMFKNSIFTEVAFGNTLTRMAILLMVGLSAFIGFNSGASNLGQFGQLLCGATVATLIGIYVKLPSYLLIPLMVVSAAAAGALYAAIAAALKHFFNMNEFITTLMLNHIAEFFVAYLIANPLKDPKAAWPMSPVISKSGIFLAFGFADFSVIIGILLFIAIYIYWTRTKQGYELRLTGANSIFARIGGCQTTKNFFTTMLISGAFSGLAGAFLIMGSTQQHKLLPSIGKANGSDGLMIAIISGNSIPSVLFFSLFFSMLQTGAVGMQLDTNVPMEFTIMLQASMVLLVVAFRDYSDIFLNKIAAFSRFRSLRRR